MRRAMQQARGFTLVEMMIVMAVSLLLLTLVVPVFHVTTRAMQSTERKLAVYEAARNILDIMELDIQQAAVNERGEHFSLKHVTFPDTDPFTPAGTQPYVQSQREACAVDYLKHQAGGLTYNGSTPYYGGMPFPLCYPTGVGTTWEGYIATIRSSLLYNTSDQKTRLADVSKIDIYANSIPKTWRNRDIGNNVWRADDEPENFAAPGHELNAPYYLDTSSSAQVSYQITGIALLDLSFAYWDDADKEFKTPPEGTAIYFAPPPKSIQITITVCDFEKRVRSTFSRIVVLPCGGGPGIVTDARDGVYSDPTTPAFNRTKDLHKVDPYVFGSLR